MKKIILAVDDEPRNLRLLEAILVPEGYVVETAINGQEAIEATAALHPDLILLDVMMPEIDGFQVCKNIRSKNLQPYIPIIFLTAMQISQKDVIQGLDVGGDDYIRKPFDNLELLSRIRAVIRVQDLYNELARTKAELSRYVSLATLEIVEKASAGTEVPMGETADVTVLFSDIRGFTHIAEHMDPANVFEMLNLTLSEQMKVIEKHHGIIDKLNGDEIMAVFRGPDMARNALESGMGIMRALCNSNHCQKADWIGVGVGINTGPVYVGSMGSDSLKDYTIVGNTVNVAAKLCDYAKKFQVVFTEKTMEFVESARLPHRSIGRVPLKGLSSPIEIFELKQWH